MFKYNYLVNLSGEVAVVRSYLNQKQFGEIFEMFNDRTDRYDQNFDALVDFFDESGNQIDYGEGDGFFGN